MKTLNAVWKSTTMVVLTALCGALFAAILIPFKLLPIIPGVTEVRPANAIPIACSLLFGPAAAWGSAFGNLVGDFAFGLGPGSLIGMVGNFLYGFAPYAIWRTVFGAQEPRADKASHWVALIFICIVASAACAFTIGWGIDVILKGVPFAILGTIIFFNNLLMALLLAPPLLFALLPRVKAWGLLWTDIVPAAAAARPRFAWLGVAFLTVGSIGGMVGGLGISTGIYNQPISVPWFLKQLESVAVLGGGKPEVSATPAAEGVRAPASGQATAAARPASMTRTSGATGIPAPAAGTFGKTGVGLGLGTLPALILIFVGLLLL